jgi:hypothetical protein
MQTELWDSRGGVVAVGLYLLCDRAVYWMSSLVVESVWSGAHSSWVRRCVGRVTAPAAVSKRLQQLSRRHGPFISCS